jgi:hypothetical protein
MNMKTRKTLKVTLCWLVLAAALGPAGNEAVSSPGPAGSPEPEVVIDLAWGSGGMMLGRIDGSEAASYGPLSFGFSPVGDLYFLDQVNFRIMKIHADGSPGADIALPLRNCDDMAIAPDGSIVLLDKLDRLALVVMDELQGTAREHTITGEGIPEGRSGLVTAMFAESDGVWLEYQHATLVRILDASMRPAERVMLPGRKFDGTSVSVRAELQENGGARMWLEDVSTGAFLAGRDIAFDHPIDRIIWIDRSGSGNLFALFHLIDWSDQPPYGPLYEEVRGVRLDRNLAQTGVMTSPFTLTEWRQHREFIVAPDGGLYQMVFTDAGVRILRWRLP